MASDSWGPREVGWNRPRPKPYLRPATEEALRSITHAMANPVAMWVQVTKTTWAYHGHPSYEMRLQRYRPRWYRRARWRVTATNRTTGDVSVHDLGTNGELARRTAVFRANNRMFR